MTKVAKLLKDRMDQMKLSADQVAEACGVNRATVYRWLSGEIDNMKRSNIAALAKILQLDPALIVGDLDEEDSYEYPIILPEFKTAQEAIKFILEVPMVAQFGGYNLESMSDQELIDMANLVAQLIRGVAYTTTPDANDNSDPRTGNSTNNNNRDPQ